MDVSIGDLMSFERLPVAAAVLDTGGDVVEVNPAGCGMVGRDRAQVIGRSALELFDITPERWRSLLAAARCHGQAAVELAIPMAIGPVTVQAVISLVVERGVELVQLLAIDLSARKLADDSERARAQAEDQTAAKQRLESLGLVAGGIAHDFNNLLVGVLAEASAAREDRAINESTRDALRRIEAAARRMSQLTKQLLAYAGRGQFVTTHLDPDAMLRELSDHLARIVHAPVALAVAPGAGTVVVEADPGLLRQVVVNLVTNANDAGSRRVEVATRILSREGTSWWQLEVSDDGGGIDPAMLGRIFEPFFTTKRERHGLGLSAVHGIVRRLGGDIELDSTPGQGARFRVRLPIVPGAEPPRRAQSEPGIPALRLAGLRILLADDEPSVRATVRRLLERRGGTVVVAADGLEAEARLRDERFDLVILDVSMPGKSGYDVLSIARMISDVPVILMSGYHEKLRGQGGDDEPDLFLEKPFTSRVLEAAIDDVMRGKRATDDAKVS